MVSIDKFGHLRLNLTFEKELFMAGKRVKVSLGGAAKVSLPILKTFGEAELDQPFFFKDSSGLLAIGVNRVSVAERFKLKAGDTLTIYLN